MNTGEEFFVASEVFRRFVAHVTRIVHASMDRRETVVSLRPAFATLLRDQSWLPDELARPVEDSGMGRGIASYLLYRTADRSLSVSSLVISAGTTTPVHDHLAWGLVGLYRGEQEEEVYRRLDDGSRDGEARLVVTERRQLRPGDFYDLLPPDGDIHRVVCPPVAPSISIHLLGNDVGCIHRHAFDPERDAVRPFRSGYANVPCEEDGSPRQR